MSLIERLYRALPSLITLTGLACGLTATLVAGELAEGGSLVAPSLLLLGAVMLDFLDGATARALGLQSDFGRELDSLSDLVCFGVAPAALLHHALTPSLGTAGAVLAVAFGLAAAVRLARFNVWTGRPEAKASTSIGLTAPMAACACVASMLLGPALLPPPALAWIALVLLLLMVSTIPYRTTKGLERGALIAAGVLLASLAVAVLFAGPIRALAIAALGYAASGPTEWTLRRVTRLSRTTGPRTRA